MCLDANERDGGNIIIFLNENKVIFRTKNNFVATKTAAKLPSGRRNDHES